MRASEHWPLLVLPALFATACGIVEPTSDAGSTPDASTPPHSDARAPHHDAHVASDASAPRDASSDATLTHDAFVCAAPSLTCGTACVDPQTDVHHCGDCGTDCTTLAHIAGASASCQAGACQFTCAPGYANCGDAGGGCTTSLSANATCGSCTTACSGETPVCGQIVLDGGAGVPPLDGGLGCVEGCTPTTDVRCGGVCVDEQTDVNNCGRCGVTCGGQCALGRCLLDLAVAVAPYGADSVTPVAVDSTNVYWIDPSIPFVDRVPINGGTVVTNQFQEPNAPHQPPYNMALGPNGIYLASESGVFVAPYDGGLGEPFPSDAGLFEFEPVDLVAGPTGVYWIDYFASAILVAPFDGGPATVVRADSNYPQQIVASPSSLFWTEGVGDGGVVRFTLDGGAVAVEPWGATPQLNPILLWAAGDIYLGSRQSISRVAGGEGTPMVLVSTSGSITSFAADGTNLYWAELDSVGSILSQPVRGGAVTTLATNLAGNNVGLVADATSLYWVDDINGELMKLTPK